VKEKQKQQIRTAIHKAYSKHSEPIPGTKPQSDQAIEEIGGWLALNSTAINTALPLAWRTKANAADKALLVAIVAASKFLEDNPGKVDLLIDSLRQLEQTIGQR